MDGVETARQQWHGMMFWLSVWIFFLSDGVNLGKGFNLGAFQFRIAAHLIALAQRFVRSRRDVHEIYHGALVGFYVFLVQISFQKSKKK